MRQKTYLITRLERSTVLKRVDYEIAATNKETALRKLDKMQYLYRNTRDEVQEDDWQPLDVMETG